MLASYTVNALVDTDTYEGVYTATCVTCGYTRERATFSEYGMIRMHLEMLDHDCLVTHPPYPEAAHPAGADCGLCRAADAAGDAPNNSGNSRS